MKRLYFVKVALVITVVLLFSGCAVINNIFNPLPDEYKDGVKYSRDYPDDELELYDDALVFEADEDDEEITLKYGSEDELDDLIDFYEDLFDDKEMTIDEAEEGRDDYHAEGRGDGFKFEIDIEQASGDYETRVFKTVVEIEIVPYEVGEQTLENMQGFWLVCGLGNDISDDYRKSGQAMEVDGMKVTFYSGFEAESADNDFSFDDDDTIRYTDEGEEHTSDVTFETIEGKEYMVISEGDITVCLEKSSEDEMMSYKMVGTDTLKKLQGFWLICGADGQIDDQYRMAGQAIDFNDVFMDFYDGFEVDTLGNEFVFLDENTINYTEEGTEYTVAISFETVSGVEYLVMTVEAVSVYLEKSSYDTMLSYKGSSVIYLSDYLTDEQLEYYITDIEWNLSYIYNTDGTFDQAENFNRITFDSYYNTGVSEFSDIVYDHTWYIEDSIIYFDFGNDFYDQYLLDYEFDGEAGYLYLFDSEAGYNDYALVYTVYVP